MAEVNPMRNNFSIEYRKSHGNLHVYPKGDLNGSSACQLVEFIHKNYSGRGRVFINTNQIREVLDFGIAAFKYRISQGNFAKGNLFFKGEKGLKIAPNGCKIIVQNRGNQCQCNGNCARCLCQVPRTTGAQKSE
jgi:hypothetical protein